MEGRKDDSGKPRWDLLPFGALEEVARVLTFGARKYADDNWKKVPDLRRRYLAASLRHVYSWRKGEAKDPETGLHHLAHAACCLLFVLSYEVGMDPELETKPATRWVPTKGDVVRITESLGFLEGCQVTVENVHMDGSITCTTPRGAVYWLEPGQFELASGAV